MKWVVLWLWLSSGYGTPTYRGIPMTEGWLGWSVHSTMGKCLDARTRMLKASPRVQIVCVPADSKWPEPQAEVRGTTG